MVTELTATKDALVDKIGQPRLWVHITEGRARGRDGKESERLSEVLFTSREVERRYGGRVRGAEAVPTEGWVLLWLRAGEQLPWDTPDVMDDWGWMARCEGATMEGEGYSMWDQEYGDDMMGQQVFNIPIEDELVYI
eukprot:gene11244-17774_t